MNVALNTNINSVTTNAYAMHNDQKSVATNKEQSDISKKDGVILELSEEARQTDYVIIKEKNADSHEENYNLSETAETVSTKSLSTSEIRTYQRYLNSLGFYSGSIDGNASSKASIKAITNFQRVYGLTESGTIDSATASKLNTAYHANSAYKTCSGLKTIADKLGLDNTQKENFALSWTFLKIGMGLSTAQAAGVMGNIYQESGFSASNAQDSSCPGLYDKNYTFNAMDY